MAGIQSEQIIWPEAQYPEIKENIEGPRPENPDDTFLIEGATPYQQSEETPAVDLNSPDLISDPQDEQDYPSQSMNPTLFQTGDNPDLSEIMRSRDLVGAAYPAFRPFVRQLAAEGVPVSRTHEALAMLEDQLRATMKPDELDMYFGRNDDSRWVERFLLETNWTDRLSRELGITGREAAERLEVAKKTGLSLRLLSDPAVFKKALEGKKLSDSKKEAVKNNYRIEDLQDKIGRSSTSDMFTVLETEWWGNKNLTDEQKKYLDSSRKARKELYNKVADLRNVIYTSRAADILGSGTSLFTQQFITPLPEIMRNAAMLFGLTTATGLAVPEIADASAVALPGTYGLVTSALGAIAKLGVNHPFSAAMLLGGAAISGAAFEHTMMLEGGMLYDEILDALDEGADAFQKDESARAAQDSNYTARKPWNPAKNRLLAAKLALIGGAINGYIEIGNMGIMLNTVSGGAYDRAKDMLIKSVGGENGMLSKMGKRQLKSWAARALKDYAINYIKSSGTEGLEEYLQSLFSNTLLEIGKAIAGKSNRSVKEVLEAIHRDGWGGFTEIAKGMLVTGIPGGVINAGARYQESVREKAIAAQPKLFSDDQAARIEAEKTLRAEDAEHVPTSEIKTEPLSETGTQGELKTAAPDFAYDPANVVTGIEDADVKASAAPAAEPEQTPSSEAAPTPETQPEQADKQTEQTEEAAEPAVPAAEQETEKAKTELRPASPERVGAAYQETVLPSSVYVSSEAMDAYLQTLPENERETLRQALRMRKVDKTGEYLMRAKDFVAAGKRFDGLERAVAEDVRRGPLGMTRRELTSIKDKVRYKESDPMEGSSQIAVEAREVRDDMTKKLRAIGYSQEQAEVMADAQAHAIFGFSRLYGIDPVTGNWTGEVLSPKAWYEQLEIRRAQQQTPQESAAEAAGTIAQDNNGVFNQELFQPDDYDENGRIRPEVIREITDELNAIRSEAQANGTYLMAENGNPSNLPAGVWEMVRTRRFREWFGESKIVDANGEPKIVYHGTTQAGFTQFDTAGSHKTADAGAFFSDRKQIAGTYAGGVETSLAPEYDESGNLVVDEYDETLPLDSEHYLYPVFLKVEHPYVVDAQGRNWDEVGDISIYNNETDEYIYEKEDGTPFMSMDDARDYIETELGDPDFEIYEAMASEEATTDEIARAVYKGDYGGDYVDGVEVPYDGVIFANVVDEGPAGRGYSDESTVISVPTPEQIKSVDNRGTFDARENIFYQNAANIAKLTSEERAVWDEAVQGLTESERSRIENGNVSSARGFVSAYEIMPSIDEYAAAAIAGRAKKGWYARSAVALREIFGEDTDRFTALLAATSPRCSVETNLMNSLKVWKAWNEWTQQHPGWEQWDDIEKRRAIIQVMRENMQQADLAEEGETGESTQGQKKQNEDKKTKEKLGPVLPSWVNNTVTALTTSDAAKIVLSGPKVHSFMHNLRGDLSYVTNDTWMANSIGRLQEIFSGSDYKPEQGDAGYSLRYLAMNARVRLTAEMLTQQTGEKWEPAEVQETIWSWGKTLTEYAKNLAKTQKKKYNEGGKKGDAPVVPSFREIIDSGVLTDEMIGSTVDFAQLVTQGDGVNDYRTVLEEAGYGEKLEQLDKEIAARPMEGRGPESPADQGTVRHAPASGLDGRRDALYRVADRFDASFRGGDEIHKKLLAVRSQFGSVFGPRDGYSDGYQNRGDVSDQSERGGTERGSSEPFVGPYQVYRGREGNRRSTGILLSVDFDLGLKNPVKVKATAEYVLDRGVAANLKEVFAATPRFYELAMDEKNIAKSAKAFRQALLRARKSQGIVGLCVEVKSLKDYMNQSEDSDAPKIARLVLTEGARAGFAITEDGDIVSAFSMKGAPIVDGEEAKPNKKGKFPTSIHAMLMLAVQMGGRHMDCFDTVLPRLYSHMGFRAVSRCAWNEKYKPTGWNNKVKKFLEEYNNGEPDVVFLVYDPNYNSLYRSGEGVMAADYGAASEIARQEMAKLREQSQTLSQQSAQTFNQDAVANSIGDTEHGYGVAVNEKGQLVGGSNRFEQSAFQGSKVKGIKQFDWQTYSGTGEGGAAHGAGTYAAQERAVAEGYREYLNDNEYDYTFTQGGKNINEDLATALKRTLPSALKEAVERGGALELDDYQKTVLANLQKRAEIERRWESYRDRQIMTEQSIIEKIDANPGMTLQEFFKVFKQPLQDGRKVGLAFDDAYHHATQNAIRDGRDSATLADFRAVIEDDLKPMLLWRDDVLKDAEVLASADLAGINVKRRQGGALYELDVPENDVLLDEQKAFKEQSKTVKDSLRALYEGMTAQQKRDFAARLFPDKFTRGHEVELEELIRAFKEPAHLFELLSDATKSPPARNNARGALRSLGYTEEQLDRFYRDSDLARTEAARFAEKDAGKLAELQQQLEQERAANDAKEKQFLEKGIFNSLSRTTKIPGRGIYNAIAYALRDDKMNDPRAASLALNNAGIKGITYDGAQDGRCFVIFDDNAIEIVNRYEQEKSQGQPRGSITFNGRLNEGGTAVIDLFKAADASTFIHESAHFLLQSYLDFGRMVNAPAQLKQDLGVILNFLGVKDAGEVGREQHEKWARTVELYFMEGKAPSSALAKVFARMKRWLLGIYHHARHLNTEITPEVREVLDRLYAGMNEEDAEVATLSDLRQDDEAAAEAVARMEAEEAQEQQDAASPKTQNRRQASRIREALKRAAERRRKAQAELKAKQQERKLLKKEIAGILKKIKAAAEDKGILWAFQEKIRGVLAGYTLKNPSRQKLMQAMELYNYLIDHPGEMSIEDYAPADRAYIEMLGTTMLPDMTLGELRALGQHIEELREEGKKAYEQWKAARQQRRDQMWNECYAALGEIPSSEGKAIRGARDLRKEYKGMKGKLEKAKDWTLAATLNSHRLMDWIGNGKGLFKSAWTKWLINKPNGIHDTYLRNRNDRYVKIDAVLQANGLTKFDLGRTRVIDGQQYSIDEMLSVYALMKNEKGRKALIYGNFKGLTDPEGHAARIVQALTREEINVADAVLQDYEDSFDRLNKRFIEAFNEGMVKEENYSPMKRLEYTNGQGVVDAESEETLEGRSVAAGRMAGLERGFLVRRMEISEAHQQPVDLGLLSIWSDQVTAQEHTAAFAEYAGDLSSFLKRRNEVNGMTMAKAIRMKYGTEAWQSVVGYANLIILNESRQAHDVMNGISSKLVRAMSMVYIAGNLGGPLKQIASLPRFALTAGLPRLVSHIGRWAANPAKYMEESYRLDPQLRERKPNAAYAAMRIDPTVMSWANYRSQQGLKALMWLLGVMDRSVAAIGWRATYDAEIARGASRQDAHLAAQRAVALTQQVPNPKDMPAYWRQSGLAKLMMVFSSNSIPIWGMTVYDLAKAIQRGSWPAAFKTTFALSLAAIATMYMSHGLPDGDDDDSLLDWMVDAFTEQTITSLPIIGKDMFAAYDELINRNKRGTTYSALVTPVARTIQGAQRIMSEKADEVMQSGLTRRETGVWQVAEGLSLLLGGLPVTMARRIRTALKSGDANEAMRIMLAWQRQKKKATKKAVSW